MITKVSRGARAGGLLAYLFGPGKHNEHTDQHLVACWDGDLAGRGPSVGEDGRFDVRALSDALNVDLKHLGLSGRKDTIWHTVVALHPKDGLLDDWAWAQAAQEMVEAVGLEDDRRGAVRWVAVRHGLSTGGDDHIHIVAALAGVDDLGRTHPRRFLGGRGSANSEFGLLRAAANRCEARWGLTRTGTASGAGHKVPTRGERERAARVGSKVTSRESLAAAVRSAALRVGSADELVAVLAEHGVVAEFTRASDRRAGTYLGVTFHHEGHVNADGEVVRFPGGKLGRDLTAPALQHRWDAAAGHAAAVRPATAVAGDAAARFTEGLAAAVAGAATASAGRVHAQVSVAADGLWLLAGIAESDPHGPWHDSAAWAARVAREPVARPDFSAGVEVLAEAVAELGMAPRGQTRSEREWARAYLLFHQLLRAWAKLEPNPTTAQLARDTAVRIEANTLLATRRTTTGPINPTPASSTRQLGATTATTADDRAAGKRA